MTRKTKLWWKKHWDEVMLVVGVSIGGYLILKGLNVI